MKKKEKYILWFNQVDKQDTWLVGGKGANLGEMASFDIPVPDGFIVTAPAYFNFIKNNKLSQPIKKALAGLSSDHPETFNEASLKIKKLILKEKIDKDLAKKIINSYIKLGSWRKAALVAVRSSATAEDLPEASFAGQQATFLNIQGEANVIQAVKECWASLFEARAIFYRQEKGFDHFKVGMAVPVQTMVPASVSGVMFTIDPVTNNKEMIVIEAIWGLGELIVQGRVIPDRYLVTKKGLEISQIDVAKQAVQLIKAKSKNKEVKIGSQKQTKRKLTNSQIKELAGLGKKIHQHYYFPQDIEWCFHKGKFWILQTRPVTTLPKAEAQEETQLKVKKKPLLTGFSASPGLAAGPVKIIKSARQLGQINQGDVLVTPMTSPDFVPAMKKTAAIVTDKGGQTSHAAIVSRELGIPCVVGTKKGTRILKKQKRVTVNGSLGEIYAGGQENLKRITIKPPRGKKPAGQNKPLKTATKLYVNLGEPDLAPATALKNVDGVGLLRAEFMMAQIGIHPQKIIKEKRQKEFIEKLTSDLKVFCQSFSPRPVIYRTSDFKTNEYRHLKGGKAFEPEEENPLLGFRGALRYLVQPEVLELELAAIKKVRNSENLKNLWVMIPFCRTPQELLEVKKILAGAELRRSPSFKLWLMVEVPANVILLKDFIKVGIDGVSIGSNDLTMLLLGMGRDNPDLAKNFNEQNPAVLWALEKTIKTCRRKKISTSICGQAPSLYPDLVEKLVGWGITSLSVNPDAIERTRTVIYEAEKKLTR